MDEKTIHYRYRELSVGEKKLFHTYIETFLWVRKTFLVDIERFLWGDKELFLVDIESPPLLLCVSTHCVDVSGTRWITPTMLTDHSDQGD